MSDWKSHLSKDQIREVIDAIVDAGWCRESNLEAYLSGISYKFVSGLPSSGLAPKTKLQLQLNKMNKVSNLRNGEVPLILWLENVIDLSGGEPQTEVVEKVLESVSLQPNEPPAEPAGLGAVETDDGEARLANLKVDLEAMVGSSDDTQKVAFLSKALVATASVCKVLVHRHIDGEAEFGSGDVPRLANGTGWFIGPRLLITNHHVINARQKGFINEPDATPEDFKLQAAHTDVLFDYFEADKPSATVTSGEGALEAADQQLDFAILRLPADAPDRSPLRLRKRLIKKNLQQGLGTRVNLLQHPNGQPMRIGFRDNFVVLGDGDLLAYLTDTKTGSSGSPVCDDSWSVAALHSGTRNISDKEIQIRGKKLSRENFGIPIPAIMDKLESDFPTLHAEIVTGQG